MKPESVILKYIKYIICLIIILFSGITQAAHRTAEQALAIARQHADTSSPTSAASAPAKSRSYTIAAQSDAYYAVNTNHGFILVSADDRMPDILGYSDNGTFHADSLPPALRYWLDAYDEEVALLNTASVSVRHANTSLTTDAVAPLLRTQWDQGQPYNLLAPSLDGNKCPAGCVATAMAQIMNYYQHPLKGNGSHSYSWYYVYYIMNIPIQGSKQLSADFGNTTYQWEYMLDSYSGGYTSTQADAVATLLYHCGVAVDMQYDVNGSGSNGIKAMRAFINYFDYDDAIVSIAKDASSKQTLYNNLAKELQLGCPIYVTGLNSQGTEGHAFVCDGYNEDGLFHFNWGWSGTADGYYSLYALNPTAIGIGGGLGSYNNQTTFYTGIRPKGKSKAAYMLSVEKVTSSATKVSLNSRITITLNNISNQSFHPFSGECAIALVNGSDTMLLGTNTITDLQYGIDRRSLTFHNIRFPSNISGEDYLLCCLYRPTEQQIWQVMTTPDGPCSYPIAVVDDQLEIRLPPTGKTELSWELTTDSILNVHGNMEMPDYSSVASNSAPWYGLRDSIKYLTMSTGITRVGAFAFYRCSNMQAATLPFSVNKIGRSAFYRCTSLESIEIPLGCHTIEYAAFDGCTALNRVKIKKGMLTLEDYSFNNCRNLLSIICDEPEPPTVSAHTFQNVPRTANIIVPVEAEEAYRAANGWREFYINGISPTGERMATESVRATPHISKEIRNSLLIITMPDGTRYNILGQPLNE